MAEAVLDASALVAFLRDEPGAAKVAAVLTRSCISAVNLCETISKMVQHGKPLDDVSYQIERLRIEVVSFDAGMARMTASLWKVTRPLGLSLGDRACLVLGLKTGCPVVTADAAWAKVETGVKIVMIR